ncbi:MAG: ABC transporter ATP-binding protein, partial [Tepidiformaceae bacterium]
TIRLLLALQRPTAGRAEICGFDAQRDSVEIHRRVGYLPGELELYPHMNGQQHIDWFARARGITDLSVARKLAEQFGVTLDRAVRDLSKGNRQKIGIVLAFLHRPELLILDEPTSGLDPLMQNEFDRLIRETVAEGRTVFLSSHELNDVQRLADRVAILRSGRLVTVDTVDHLRQNAPRRLEARFAHAVDASQFAGISGITVTESQGSRIAFQISGPLAPLLRAIADQDPVDVTSRPADLDELFLDLYRESPSPEPHVAP